MRKALILVVLATTIAGGYFLLDPVRSGGLLPEPSSTHAPPADSNGSDSSVETDQAEAAWEKLRERLNQRAADVSGASADEPDSQTQEQPPVFDTRADWLAAAGVTPEDEGEFLTWSLEHGIEAQPLGYEHYDRDTLQALADSGDMFALQRLGNELAWGEQRFVQAEVLYREAAARGSVVAVDRLALNEISKAMAAASDDQRESSKRHLLKALAWTEVSRRRSGPLMMPEERESNARQHLKNIDATLSDEDREHIQAQAEALYQQLSEGRAELNLGEFDNSRPAMLEKLERQGLDKPSIRNP